MPQSSSLSSVFVPVNGSVVPAAASQSVHVNGSVVPAAASRPAHVQTVDDIAALMSNMSISKPTVVKPTSASSSRSHASKLPVATSSASKDCPSLRQHQPRSLANIAPSVNQVSVSDRIAERRRRVIANITPGSKRTKLAVKATSSSSRLSSSSPPAVAATVPIVPAAMLPKKGKARGDSKYCSGRPRGYPGRGPHGYTTLSKGRLCGCGGDHEGAKKWHVHPSQWATTPAESGKDRWPKPKKCNKTVRFADPIKTFFTGEKPWDQVLEGVPESEDPATREDDFPEGFCVTVN